MTLATVRSIGARFACDWTFPNATNERLQNFCGPLDQNLRHLEQNLQVRIKRRADYFEVSGSRPAVERTVAIMDNLNRLSDNPLLSDQLQLILIQAQSQSEGSQAKNIESNDNKVGAQGTQPYPMLDTKESELSQDESPVLQTRRNGLEGRTPNQRAYLRAIQQYDVTFGIGPAGTGKTYLAVACAVDALERDKVQRIVLTRPAVEAGERLGFLPGDLAQKVDPYLRPLYDALYDLLGYERTGKLFEKQIIEIAPLAYMRGRTLNHSFVILDEAQNTTPEQMKMFLTRLGFGSKAVITGDVTQIDLPKHQTSGLVDARQVLARVKGVAFAKFTSQDVVRHSLVAKIIEAYEAGNPHPDE